jgi:hypothetical protein
MALPIPRLALVTIATLFDSAGFIGAEDLASIACHHSTHSAGGRCESLWFTTYVVVVEKAVSPAVSPKILQEAQPIDLDRMKKFHHTQGYGITAGQRAARTGVLALPPGL